MGNAVIFSNGNLSEYKNVKRRIRRGTYIISADGAAQNCLRAGIHPDLIIGDMDSLPIKTRDTVKNIKQLTFPRRKNNTDFELALQYAINEGFRNIEIYGLLGDRLDHMFANIFLLKSTADKYSRIKITIIEGKQYLYFTKNTISIKGKKGDLISIIPLEKLNGIQTKGLEYKLDHASLSVGETKGVSNVMLSNTASIKIQKGTALLVHTKNR